jgi:hypothetical protein
MWAAGVKRRIKIYKVDCLAFDALENLKVVPEPEAISRALHHEQIVTKT